MEKSIKVGIFVLAALVLGGIAVFLIGENRRLWDPKVTYNAAFHDVAGLKPGAPVRMGGVDIGTVESVGHNHDPRDVRIYVRLNVVKHESERVREDTVARVANKGLLGDKMIELSSDGKGAALAPGHDLKTEEPLDINKYIVKLEDIANKAGKAIENVETGTRVLSDPQFSDDLKVSVHSLREVLEGIAKNDSAVHRALMDPHEGQKFDRMLSNLEAASADFHDVTTHLREGPGVAHALVYDGELSKSASGSMAEVHKDLEAIRTGNGLAHALIYGDTNSQHLMGNVNAMSDDMRDIVHGLKQGKGTLGALLVDPSVYEDIKSVVGNVDRNQVLRALVRYSIKADETRQPPKVEEGKK
ncbi:MlaD family protein [Pendulispora brunnea]|uniref:MlaD family protein n=1 Tax=Pendulispora brunnea TaxID=2905690 RepID=A0ABZ2JZE0_9BACT